ncbi:MAG TPA: hypothetical protein VFH56_02175 [Acidimicrobiales bacterium]|nr:hypothetical protein [Acidimicrobiales bacterium]
MGVYSAVQAELSSLGEVAQSSAEAQRALVLAAALDDRAGIQAGGLASTDKRLGELLAEIRQRFKKPERKGRLELLRDPDSAAG